ncbi:unnamed protein product [Linum tenue]|uniref:S-protein homolog n=1 Tax=Linum tenue TaxID=586396 RepID=A0AAV0IH68_9ROSI|nr:unnamed protein product [Linum tenue]
MSMQLLVHSKLRPAMVVVAAALMIAAAARPTVQMFQPRSVSVVNMLSDRKLIVHCRSKDDDLGAHVVEVGSELRWVFVPLDATLFWCKLAVEDRRHSFDAYDGLKGDICCRDIHWMTSYPRDQAL